MGITKKTLLIATCFSLVSCAGTHVQLPSYDELLQAETAQNGRACVRQHNIRGYGLLDDDVISIDASGRNRHYLLTTWFRCNSLQTSFAAGFKGDFAELCGGSRDKIITSEESCPIKSIFEFKSRDEAVDAFKKAQGIRQTLREEARKPDKKTQA